MSENPYKVGDKVKIRENGYVGIPTGQVGEVTDISSNVLCMVKHLDDDGKSNTLAFYLYELEAIPEPEEEPLAEWERELLGLNDELKVGDRVKIKESGPYGWRDQTGTIFEDLSEDAAWDFKVEMDDTYLVPFYKYELEKIHDPRPEPEPETQTPETQTPETQTPQYTGRELKVGDKVRIVADEYSAIGFQKGDVVEIKRLDSIGRGPIGAISKHPECGLKCEITFHDYELELFEYHGVQVGDAVMTTNALNYGRVGTVQRLISGQHPADVAFDDGLLTPIAFAPHELIVLRDIDTSEMNEEYLFMVIREALVEAGKLRQDTRTQIKKSTEKGIQTIREYLAQRDSKNQVKGYKRGKSDGSRAGYQAGLRESVRRGVDDLSYLIIQAENLINDRHEEMDAA